MFIGILAVVMMLSLAACSKGPKMSEEEIKEACFKEAGDYVGGYLSNSSANYLKKYDNDPEELLGRYKNSGNDSRCHSPFYPADCVKVAPQRCPICCFFSVDKFTGELHLHGLFFRTAL